MKWKQKIGQTQGTAPTKNCRGEPCVHPKNNILLLISTILIILAFFTWILFEKNKNNSELEKIQNKKYYINLEQLKTKLKINNSNPNIIIKLNGEKLNWEKILKLK